MGLRPKGDDPPIVKYSKWGAAILVFLGLLWTTGAATIVTGVRWAAKPMWEAEANARAKADSTMFAEFVSRLNRSDAKLNGIAIALTYPEGSARREDMLREVLDVRRYRVAVPEEIQSAADPENK